MNKNHNRQYPELINLTNLCTRSEQVDNITMFTSNQRQGAALQTGTSDKFNPYTDLSTVRNNRVRNLIFQYRQIKNN